MIMLFILTPVYVSAGSDMITCYAVPMNGCASLDPTGSVIPDVAEASYAASLLSRNQETDRLVEEGISSTAPFKQAAWSLLLPGLAQKRMGRDLRAKVYFSLEGIAWVTAGAFYWQSIARKNAYEEYAVAYAGVSGTGLSEDYYETIGNYMSNEGPGGYNEYVMRDARDLYYPDKEAMDSYYEQNILAGEQAWRWENEQYYRNYRELFAGSDASRRRVTYAFFFAMGLRVVSMVDAMLLARSDDMDGGRDHGVSIDIKPEPGGFRMSLCHSF